MIRHTAIAVALICPLGALALAADPAIDTDSRRFAGDARWISAQRDGPAVEASGLTRYVVRNESAAPSEPIYRFGQRELPPEELPMKGRAPVIERAVPGDR